MTTNEEIADEYEFSGGWIDYISKEDFIKSLNKARAEGYKEGQKDASKEILNFVYDKWNLGIYADDLDQKEIDRYYKEEQELWKKYNY